MNTCTYFLANMIKRVFYIFVLQLFSQRRLHYILTSLIAIFLSGRSSNGEVLPILSSKSYQKKVSVLEPGSLKVHSTKISGLFMFSKLESSTGKINAFLLELDSVFKDYDFNRVQIDKNR